MQKPGGWFIAAGLVIAGFGGVALMVGIGMFASGLSGLYAFEPRSAPGTFTEELDGDRGYTLAIESDPESEQRLAPFDGVTVTSPSGASVVVDEWPEYPEFFVWGEEAWGSAADFDTDEAGTYRFDVRTAGDVRVRVAPRVGPVYSLLMFASAIVGLLAGLLGLALLIVGLLWRNRASSGGPPTTPTPTPVAEYPPAPSAVTVARHG
ncbi:MAG: hypothetical protein AAGD35_07060 [Actinomycetota bacterium]